MNNCEHKRNHSISSNGGKNHIKQWNRGCGSLEDSNIIGSNIKERRPWKWNNSG